MELKDCIFNRRSVRKYLDLEVPREMVGEIIQAGSMAPSSGNLQNWGFIIVRDKSARNKMADACLQQDWMANANVHIVVCGLEDPSKHHYGLRGERLYTVQNCAAAIQNMLLTAHDLGLGSCWIGGFDEGMVKDICDIPDNVRPQAVLAFGIPDEKPDIPKRENIYNMSFFEEYDSKVEDSDECFGYHGDLMLKSLKSSKETVEKKTDKWLDKLEKHTKKFLNNRKENK
ncbi:MAG: nitroreductase family protein [Nanoarchaeota archaeon]|nr:nitroreductase family protein [Nanoarchaeota archaeon]